MTGEASELRVTEALLDSPVGNGVMQPFMLSQPLLGIKQVWFSEDHVKGDEKKHVKLIDAVVTSITEYTFCISCSLNGNRDGFNIDSKILFSKHNS